MKAIQLAEFPIRGDVRRARRLTNVSMSIVRKERLRMETQPGYRKEFHALIIGKYRSHRFQRVIAQRRP